MEKKYHDPAAFSQAVLDILKEYLANEEAYGDNPQLEVKLPSLELALVADDDDAVDEEHADYYPVLDLISMDTVNPGQWQADAEAVENLTGEYFA